MAARSRTRRRASPATVPAVSDTASSDAAAVDRLIRELIETDREATSEEVGRIVGHIAAAPFDPRVVPVAVDHRALTHEGRTLGSRENALVYHLVQRVVVERQWAEGTTPERYLADLRQAVRTPDARLVVYFRRGGHIAVTVTPTDRVLSPGRRGVGELPNLLVVYSADRGIIVTGYQFSTIEATGIPRDARWLR